MPIPSVCGGGEGVRGIDFDPASSLFVLHFETGVGVEFLLGFFTCHFNIILTFNWPFEIYK